MSAFNEMEAQMITRELGRIIQQDAKLYPVVTLVGPRQSGKTTLAKMCFPDYEYVNLEDIQERELATEDERKFFALHKPPVIIDEVQRVPTLASAVQVRVDADRNRMGAFVLTGSHQPKLSETISQSLAGRTSLLSLMPLTVQELAKAGIKPATDELLLKGFMPDVHVRGIPPDSYYRNYFQTYVERDVRQLINLKNTVQFERFITLLAGRVGQVVNLSSLAVETGVSSTTLKEWLSLLEASFLIFRLPPYFSNISKRVVKSPKLYFTDVGLAAWLLGIDSPEQVARDPLRGQLFENMVVADIRKQLLNRGKDARMSFLRTGKGFEVDLVVAMGTQVYGVEIKSAMTYRRALAGNLRKFASEEPNVACTALVYDGADIPAADGKDTAVFNFRTFSI